MTQRTARSATAAIAVACVLGAVLVAVGTRYWVDPSRGWRFAFREGLIWSVSMGAFGALYVARRRRKGARLQQD